MAHLIPDNLKSRTDAPPGVRQLAKAFQTALDDDAIVWYEPPFDTDGDRPHFVVYLPEYGLAVIEVFDVPRDQVLGVAKGTIRIQLDGQETPLESPMVRADRFRDKLTSAVEKHDELRSDGIAIASMAAIPRIERNEASDLRLTRLLDVDGTFFREDITRAANDASEAPLLRCFTHAFASTRRDPLSERALKILRAVVHPDTRIDQIVRSSDAKQLSFGTSHKDADIRVMDLRQEKFAKGLGAGHRVIRGVAGSGKTLILVYRARLVATANPNRQYLFTCFTKTLANSIARLLEDHPNVHVINLDKLLFGFIRDAGLRHPGYSGPTPEEAIARTASQALNRLPHARYDGVFLDEAQDFGTSTLKCIVQLLRDEDSDLVVVADAAQNIFRRNFSWREAGIHAQGRTRILRVNYRNTREILAFAHGFLGAPAADDLDDENVVIPPEAAERNGRKPSVCVANDKKQAIVDAITKIRDWTGSSSEPKHVAVLYPASNGHGLPSPSELVRKLQAGGLDAFWVKDNAAKAALSRDRSSVVVMTTHSAKGLEFTKVLLYGLSRPDKSNDDNRKLAYVGMTRAIDELVVLVSGGDPLLDDALVALQDTQQEAA